MIIYTQHARHRMVIRDITDMAVMRCITNGVVSTDAADVTYGAFKVQYGTHVVIASRTEADDIVILTTYIKGE